VTPSASEPNILGMREALRRRDDEREELQPDTSSSGSSLRGRAFVDEVAQLDGGPAALVERTIASTSIRRSTAVVDADDAQESDEMVEHTNSLYDDSGSGADELLPQEREALGSKVHEEPEAVAELKPFKRRVGGLFANLNNLWRALRSDEKSDGWQAAWFVTMNSAKAVKTSLGVVGSFMKVLPIVGAAFSAIEFVDTVKNSLLPLRKIRDEQSLHLAYERIKEPEERDQNKLRALLTLQSNISYEIGHTYANLGLTLTAIGANLGTALGGAYSYFVALGAMGVNLLREGVKFFWNLYKSSSAAAAESRDAERRSDVEDKQARVDALSEQIEAGGSEATAEDRERLDQAMFELREASDNYDKAHTQMLEKSNHAAFVETLQKLFDPVREGLVSDLDGSVYQLLRAYQVSGQFIEEALAVSKSGRPLSEGLLDIAIDDVSHFLAVGKPEGVMARLGNFMSKLGRMALRRIKSSAGAHEWEPLDELDLRKVVFTKYEPFKEYILKKVKNKNQPIVDAFDGTANKKLRACTLDLATRLRRGVATVELSEAKARFERAEVMAQEYIRRWLDYAFDNNAVFEPDVVGIESIDVDINPLRGESAGITFTRDKALTTQRQFDENIRGTRDAAGVGSMIGPNDRLRG